MSITLPPRTRPLLKQVIEEESENSQKNRNFKASKQGETKERLYDYELFIKQEEQEEI